MPSPNDGVYIPVTLDLSETKKQLDDLKATVEQTEMRPNSVLEDFFSGIAGQSERAAKAVADMRQQVAAMTTSGGLRAPSVGMNMAALASSSAAIGPRFNPYIGMKTSPTGTMYRAVPELNRGPFYSDRYKTIEQRGDEASQRRYEAGFQNRYLNRELSNGDMEKRIAATLKAEAAAKKLEKQNEKLIAQTRLMERQQKYGKYGGALAHIYAENQGMIGQVAGAFGRAGVMAGYGAAALTASGYSGTVEGERFGRELRGLSLQLASAMKPLMDSLTNITRRTRQGLAGMDEGQQNQLMKGGTALAGGFFGAKAGSVFGPYGSLVGGLVGAGLGYAAPDLMDPERYRRRDILAGSASRQMIAQNENLRGMSFAERQKRIEDTTQLSVERLKISAQAVKNAPDEETRKQLTKRYLEEAFSYRENVNAMNKINDEENSPVGAALAGMRRAGVKPAGLNRRDVMITDGVGFAEAGATFNALQEDLVRTDAAESANKAVVDKLEEIRQLVEKQNRPGP